MAKFNQTNPSYLFREPKSKILRCVGCYIEFVASPLTRYCPECRRFKARQNCKAYRDRVKLQKGDLQDAKP